MKIRNLSLLLFGILAVSLLTGCEANNGGTTVDAATTSSGSSTSSTPSFTPPDPAAKAAIDAKTAAADEAKAKTASADSDKAAQATGANGLSATAAPGATAPKNGEKVVVMDTNLGRIVFRLFHDKAPKTVANFEKLTEKKFYDGTKFHRVIPDFMIQGGDPNTKTGQGQPGTGGPGYTIDDEFNDTSHTRGIVSMAHTGAPNSAGSQFFICVGNPTFLDGKYAAFGQVIQGMDVADKIVALPRNAQDMPGPDEAVMKTVTLQTWPLKK